MLSRFRIIYTSVLFYCSHVLVHSFIIILTQLGFLSNGSFPGSSAVSLLSPADNPSSAAFCSLMLDALSRLLSWAQQYPSAWIHVFSSASLLSCASLLNTHWGASWRPRGRLPWASTVGTFLYWLHGLCHQRSSGCLVQPWETPWSPTPLYCPLAENMCIKSPTCAWVLFSECVAKSSLFVKSHKVSLSA